MTASEFYTSRFYAWEYRGRGWHVSPFPVHLEPPFIPFVRHGFPIEHIDDGKRHTLVSKFFESLKGEKKAVLHDQQALDYDTLEPFTFEDDRPLTALQVKLSKDHKITPEKMKAVLVMLSYSILPISFEIIGTATEIILQFVCTETVADTIETYINAYFPQCSVIQNDAYLENIVRDDLSTYIVDFGLKHEFVRPLNTVKNFSMDPLIGVISVLERLRYNQHAGIQILFQSTVNQWNESILHSVTMYDGSSFFIDVPEAPQLAREKVHSLLFGVTIRAFAQDEEVSEASLILQKLSIAIVQGSKGMYNELIPLSDTEYDFATRVDDIFTRTSHRLGMLLNVDELVTLLHFPSENIVSQKLFTSLRKTKDAPRIARGKPFILGQNVHDGIKTSVTIGIEERLKHTHIIGATGTGKSTLIANLMLQDIVKGIGVVLFDPHGDLVDDVIARIPPERIKDVVLIDPSDIEYPIGLNILEAHSDVEREVLASDLVAIFKKHTTSWGDQMNAVVSNAILAILESSQGGTLHDLRRFLIEKDYRSTFLKSIKDPSVLYYWHKEYPMLKTNSIGPILTRLNTFLRPKAIRNMVVQKKGLDFLKLLNTNKIILLKLSQGLIGMENSFLLGSLILSKLHQAILQRQQHTNRNSVFMYLDEFQHFITPSIKDMISGIRKYNVGLILSHQDLQQLQREDGELLNSVLGNINTRIVFRVGEPDAKKLQDGFSGFDHKDLQNLGKGEAIIRIEQPQYDCSLDTIPLEDVNMSTAQDSKDAIIEHCRMEYAELRVVVEQSLYESFTFDATDTQEKEPVQSPKPVQTEVPKYEKKFSHIEPTQPIEIIAETKEKDVRDHRYFQTLIKKMAEARGYTATLEMQLPDGSGFIDVLLTKEGKTIAIEICNTTESEWEMRNIVKCIQAGYTHVISISGDIKQLEKIKKKCSVGIADFEKHHVLFLTPDAFISFLDQSTPDEKVSDEVHMKGYRVNVTYDAITKEEMDRKRASISNIVLNTIRKHKKK